MENEHFSSQLFLWLFVLRTVTRLAFLPPAEEEADYLPALPGKLWRHDYVVRDGFFKEKAYAVDRFWAREDGVDIVHNDLLIATPLKEMTSTRVDVASDSHAEPANADFATGGVRLESAPLLHASADRAEQVGFRAESHP